MATKRKRPVITGAAFGESRERILDLPRRILGGKTDPKRAEFFLQTILDGVRAPNYASQGTHGTYVLQSHWAWDNSHSDFATFSLEKCDWEISCEDLLKPGVSQSDRDELLKHIRGIHDAQSLSSCPKADMIRLYRVLDANYLGVDPHVNFGRGLEERTVDIHFSLLPLCDFDKDGKPIACNFL